MLALVVAIAAAYRFPGVSWGFDFSTAPYPLAHPDEEVTCVGALLRGEPEMKGGIPTERGMMAQCLDPAGVVLPDRMSGLIRAPASIGPDATRSPWGLMSIVVTAARSRGGCRGDVGGDLRRRCSLTTSGVINPITSFWVGGQIQQRRPSAWRRCSVALRIRDVDSEGAGGDPLDSWRRCIGGRRDLATRWSVALDPDAARLRRRARPGLAQARSRPLAGGPALDSSAAPASSWSPDMIAAYGSEVQKLTTWCRSISRIGPLVDRGLPPWSASLAGNGPGHVRTARLWFADRPRHGVVRARAARGRLRLVAGLADRRSTDPAVIIGLPSLITLLMLVCFNKVVRRALHGPVCARRSRSRPASRWPSCGEENSEPVAVFRAWTVLVAYQGVDAAGMLVRCYAHDLRRTGLSAAIAEGPGSRRGPICATPYAGDLAACTTGIGWSVRAKGPWDAEWFVDRRTSTPASTSDAERDVRAFLVL